MRKSRMLKALVGLVCGSWLVLVPAAPAHAFTPDSFYLCDGFHTGSDCDADAGRASGTITWGQQDGGHLRAGVGHRRERHGLYDRVLRGVRRQHGDRLGDTDRQPEQSQFRVTASLHVRHRQSRPGGRDQPHQDNRVLVEHVAGGLLLHDSAGELHAGLIRSVCGSTSAGPVRQPLA